MCITFSITSFAGLAHTVSFFRLRTPTHSQAVCSATYMQFSAVITSVRLFQRGTHVLATHLNRDALLFHHFFSPSHPFRWWLFFIMLRALLQGFQPDAAQRKNCEDLLASPTLFFFFFCFWKRTDSAAEVDISPGSQRKASDCLWISHSLAAGPSCPAAQVRFFKMGKWESTAVSTHACSFIFCFVRFLEDTGLWNTFLSIQASAMDVVSAGTTIRQSRSY